MSQRKRNKGPFSIKRTIKPAYSDSFAILPPTKDIGLPPSTYLILEKQSGTRVNRLDISNERFYNTQTASLKFVQLVFEIVGQLCCRILTILTRRDFYDIFRVYSHECCRFLMFVEGQQEPTEFSFRHIRIIILSDRLHCKFQMKLRFVYLLRKLIG